MGDAEDEPLRQDQSVEEEVCLLKAEHDRQLKEIIRENNEHLEVLRTSLQQC